MHLIIRPADFTDAEAILQLAKCFAVAFAIEELHFRTTPAVLAQISFSAKQAPTTSYD